MTTSIKRRNVIRGAAWAVPAVSVAGSAPALAASPVPGTACGVIAYPSSTAANGVIVPMTIGAGTSAKTIYAKFTTNTANSRQISNTSTYNARFGTTAYGRATGNGFGGFNVTTYTVDGGKTDFVFNQMSQQPSSETVTVSFYSDAAATTVAAVTKVAVPITDFSLGASWNCPLIGSCSVVPAYSYQDVVTMTATTVAGATVAASVSSFSNTYGNNAPVPTPAGNLSTGMYLPAANALANSSSGGSGYGGTLNTTFGNASITSFTFGYSGNIESSTSNWSSAQGIGMGAFTVCQ